MSQFFCSFLKEENSRVPDVWVGGGFQRWRGGERGVAGGEKGVAWRGEEGVAGEYEKERKPLVVLLKCVLRFQIEINCGMLSSLPRLRPFTLTVQNDHVLC